MSNTIDSSRESNPSRRICNLGAVLLGHADDIQKLNAAAAMATLRSLTGKVSNPYLSKGFDLILKPL